MTKSVQVITIGSATEDTLVLVNESQIIKGKSATCEKLLAFEYGAKIPVGRIQTTMGGAGANVALGLNKLGIKALPCVAVGGDDIGEKIILNLKNKGIDTSLCQTLDQFESDRSIILVDPLDRDRTIFYNRPVGKSLKLKNISKWKTDWVFISSLAEGWEKKLSQILKLRLLKGTRIAFNPGRSQIMAGIKFLEPFLRETSLLFLNWDEALELVFSHRPFKEKFSGTIPPKNEVFKFFHSIGVRTAIITLGKKGAVSCDGYYIYKSPGAVPKRVELTGAGDAFASGFTASWIKDEGNVKKAMGYGMANAASTILYFGAEKGLLDEASMEKKVNEVFLETMIREKRLR